MNSPGEAAARVVAAPLPRWSSAALVERSTRMLTVGLTGREVKEAASLGEAEFRGGYLPELTGGRDVFQVSRAEFVLTPAGIERVIALLCMRGLVTNALALREKWFDANAAGAYAPSLDSSPRRVWRGVPRSSGSAAGRMSR